MLDLLDDLFLDAFLLIHRVFHLRAIVEGLRRQVEQLLELADLVLAGLLESHASSAAAMVVEVAVVAEGLIVDPAVRRERV